MKINGEAIRKLAASYRDKKISQKLLFECLKGLLDFHSQYCDRAMRAAVFSPEAMGEDAYADMCRNAEKSVELAEKNLVKVLTALNRMAERAELSPVYDGPVSDSREDLDSMRAAVLTYVRSGKE